MADIVYGKKGCLYNSCGQSVCSPEGPFWEGRKIRTSWVYSYKR